MITTLYTERFVLRPFQDNDEEGLFKLDSDPEVHRYLGNRPLTDRNQVKPILEGIIKQYREYGIGRWAIIDQHSGDFIGWSGLKYETHIRPFSYYDLGYRIMHKYWGRGIATETAQAALIFGFEQLKLQEIHAAANVDNIASNRVLKKLGFKLVDTFTFDHALHHWYSLSQRNSKH